MGSDRGVLADAQAPLEPPRVLTRSPSFKPWFGRLNHNVGLNMVAKSLDGLSTGLWNGAVMATYIYLIEDNSNKMVGIAEGVFGIFCVASGLPAGWLADRMRRDRLLRIFGCLMLVATGVTTLAILLPSQDYRIGGQIITSRFMIILAAMILWGICEGYGPAADAIFADSVPSGQRDTIYTWQFTCIVVANSVGMFASAGLMYLSGNQWTVEALGDVILIGMLLSVASSCALFFFDDECTLGEESEAINHSASVADLEEAAASGQKLEYGWTSINFLLPAVLLFSDAIFGLAAGMTVKFFPVYFKTAVHLSPATTNAVLATTPLFLAPFSFVARYLGRHVGRIQTIILFETVGVSTMAYMGLVTSSWTVLPLIIPLYLVRCTANNSVYALQAAITMDYVPKSARGKWNSLDSLMMAGWSASAVAGGFLLDHHGFGFTFIITAVLQGAAVLLLFPLLLLGDPAAARHRADEKPAGLDAAETAAAGAAEETGALTAPLLDPVHENGRL